MAGLSSLISLGAQYMAKPKPIDPNKVMELGTSPYNAEMYDRSLDMLDINSDMNQDYLTEMTTAAADNTYVANRMAKQNLNAQGMGGQAGILNQLINKNMTDSNVSVQDNFNKYMRNNIAGSNSLLGQVTQNDMAVRDNAVSAYGQNITNKNNWMASMAGNVTKTSDDMAKMITQVGSMAMCDANMKENIKKVGVAKAKDGKKVNIFEYNYKGSDKKNTGVVAQDLRKTHPKAIHKGKNGKLYVKMNEVF